MTCTEGTVEFKMIDIVQEGAPDRKQNILEKKHSVNTTFYIRLEAVKCLKTPVFYLTFVPALSISISKKTIYRMPCDQREAFYISVLYYCIFK